MALLDMDATYYQEAWENQLMAKGAYNNQKLPASSNQHSPAPFKPTLNGTSPGERSLKLADRPSPVRIWFQPYTNVLSVTPYT